MSNNKNYPKIIILTLPLREFATNTPPIGSLSVISALKKVGFKNTHFYNIDVLRPEYEEVLSYIEKEKPDILGISAVVSTGYRYTKELSLDIKKRLPDTTIFLGGNLGASAEVILKKTGVDFICTGEGERTAVDFVYCWLNAKSKSSFGKVDGLAFLDEKEDLVTTPYVKNISAEEVYDIDWSILGDLGQLDFYLETLDSMTFVSEFSDDPRSHEPHRKNKTIFMMPGSKGCVARCTFCHRWDTGIRYVPVPILMKRIDYFIEKYNGGFLHMYDENFGSDKKWLAEFLKEIKLRDLLWRVGGMRARTVSFELLNAMKDAGCCTVYYGLESGSQTILDIMEKKTSIKHNYNALNWTVQNKLNTCMQLVIAMPGETSETIQETIDFANYYAELSPKINPNNCAINFAQALPGTPLYELARRKGFIGPSIEDEESYLLKISDRDARDGLTNINFTSHPRLLLEKWHFEIQINSRKAYVQKWGQESYDNLLVKTFRHETRVQTKIEESEVDVDSDSGYYAYPARAKEKLTGITVKTDRVPSLWWLIKQKTPGLIPMIYPKFFWKVRYFAILFILPWSVQKYGIKHTAGMCVEYSKWKVNKMFSFLGRETVLEPISLRQIIRKNIVPPIPTDNPAMKKLRDGR